MASGLFALLDDIAAIAKLAAASLDDTAAQAVTVGKKAAGIVIDDTAVTPRYVVGFAAQREIPIIAKIAWGSLKNKLLYLLPGALLLTAVAPWAITPLLMAGGAFLCFEGYEKLHHLLHDDHTAPDTPAEVAASTPPLDANTAAEDVKVANAIRTDFILSAEIMAISLASVTAPGFWTKAAVLATVGLLVTAMVYGAVALIVKADDVGVYLSRNGRFALTRHLGRWLVTGMPLVLSFLSLVGMAAMLWVGGGIVLHGLEDYGLGGPAHALHGLAVGIGRWFGALGDLVAWLVEATGAGVVGLGLGALVGAGVSAFARWRRPVAEA